MSCPRTSRRKLIGVRLAQSVDIPVPSSVVQQVVRVAAGSN
jgi:hypothetical protein